MRKLLLLFSLFVLCHSAWAQWTIDCSLGVNDTHKSIDNLYGNTYTRNSQMGCFAEVSTTYNLNNWFAIRSGIQWQKRKYEDVFKVIPNNEAKELLTDYFLTLPFYASFSMSFKSFILYANIGPYVGWNINNELKLSDKSRFEYGCSGGIGIKYKICSRIYAKAEGTVFRSFNDNHETGSSFFKQPSYYTVPEISLGLSYIIKN